MPPERILLIRHGETDWNAEGRWQGFARTDLNAVGRAQAQTLANYLRDRPIRAIYTSDLPRTWQTALPLAQALGLEPQADPRWREINLGKLQGFTSQEMKRHFPAEMMARAADLWGYAYPQGESRRQLQERAYAAWQHVITQPIEPEVAIVSHGGTIKTLLWKLFGETDKRLDMHIANTSVTTLEQAGEAWLLREVAAIPHLGSSQI
ncbi:MAG: histidine phosphatase family protein [Anaerolineae bacterium]|nr:histidine phosphatase family protein [Anaerolineae bacterium]